jgi:hypothetical protein
VLREPRPTDPCTVTTVDGVIWTFVEPCIGLVCACLPVIRGLFPAFAMRTTTKPSAPYGYSHGSYGAGTALGTANSHNPRDYYMEMDSSRNTSPHHFGKYDHPNPNFHDNIHVQTTVAVV